MTSKVSNKKSTVLHNFECGVKSNIKMAVIIFILHMVAAPAVVLAAIVTLYSKGDVDSIGAFAVIGVITTALAGFMGILIAIDSFSCLHNKSVVDMRLALPLTADQRFISNYLSGLAVYIVPFLAAQVFSLLGMGYGLAFMDGRTFKRVAYWSSDGTDQYVEYVCHYFSEFMPSLLKLIFAGTLVMLMLYTLTALVTVCCGSKFESIAYTILINAAIPMTVYLGFMSMFMNLFGLWNSDPVARILMCTSPAGGIAAAAEWSTGEEFISMNPMNYWLWALIYFLLTAAMGAGAFLLYRKRRAEQVSKPFVFKALYYVITTLAVFCIYAAFHIADGYDIIIPAILTTAIVYFILEVIANRGFKKIWISIFKYTGVIAASALIILTAEKTEGFGTVTRVPDISQVKSVSLNYSGFYGYFNLGYNRETGDENVVTFTEKENIETIIAAHRGRLEKRNAEYWGVGSSITITYELKGGGKLTRQYYNMTAEETELLSRLDLTEEYKTQLAEIYKKKILSAAEDFHRNEEYYTNYPSQNRAVLTSFSGRASDSESIIKISTLMSKNFYEQLAEAYAKDIMNITEENYYQADVKNIYYLTNGNSGFVNLDIPENFRNTMELIEYFGFDTVKKENIPGDILRKWLEETAENGDIKIYTAAEWRELNNVPVGTRLHADYRNGVTRKGSVNVVDDDLLALYRAGEPMNIVPENGYIIYVLGNTGLIPEELYGAAERVHAGIACLEYDDYGNPFWSVAPTEEVSIGTTRIQ